MRLLFLIIMAACLSACSSVTPEAGEEGVMIAKPWFFGHGGVLDEPASTGLTYTAFSTDSVIVNMKPMQQHVEFNDLMSKDGIPLDFDAVIRLQVTDSVKLIRDYGRSWYKTNVEAEFRNRVRQSVRKYGMNETAINTSAIESIDREVTTAMQKYIKNTGIPVKLLAITVGKANPPDSVATQRERSAAEEQRLNTEGMTEKAEVARKQAQIAKASADNAYREKLGLSPSQFIELKRIEMQDKVCRGKKCTFIIGNTPVMVATK